MQKSLVFLGAKRTPFGKNGGSMKDAHPTELAVHASRAALSQSGLSSEQIDHVVFGNVLHSATDSIYTPRHIGLKLGLPHEVPSLGINRLCGSGFQVVLEAYQQMLTGDTKTALVGGVENMSMSPYLLPQLRWGQRMGHFEVQDSLVAALFDTHVGAPMAITAEKLGAQYGVSRVEADDFAYQSQKKAFEALEVGKFSEEIAPYPIHDRKQGSSELKKDEHIRPGVQLEELNGLRAIFQKDGLVTAGNASGIVDGAAALVVSTEEEAKRLGKTPLGRMVSYGVVGCDPAIMGIGPAPAARVALARAGMTLQEMDLIEVNEAFASQALAVQKELDIPDEKFNVNGGAIAIGHPLAASGTRILIHLLYELKRRRKRYGLGSACIGGGQGIAVIVEVF
jgi:acetyl-CoA acetyltransferase family protein